MSTIPRTRAQLVDLLRSTFDALSRELDDLGPRAGNLPCTDEWRLVDLLAVRAWWTESVLDWVAAGRRGSKPITPAVGYRWNETPRLNADIVRAARRESLAGVRGRLDRGYRRALRTIERLDDRQLLGVGVFEWAGKYPIARWLSLNTARQYATARTLIRRAARRASP